ncbi:glutamate decarboxylase [Aspergillus terreus]|uniref:glutamate decarboxylase n=1 Tax=Aspergillus terreus TaxID=33178 RepID=A0A5M3Z906_ASPTE|nr:hypothetical protein ATETN484_0011051500 [Aspergillus terreus]GFF19157.1 glutamate decarboxylase [Aspergillus terreus]
MACSFPSSGTSPFCVAKKMRNSMQRDIFPSKNLGSFVTTSHDAETTLMAAANFHKNQACVEEYASISKYQQECISMLADLWRRRPSDNPFGTATTGSSEAVMLAGLAMKRACQEKNACFDRRLNVVVGSNAHACVFKFAAYFELETRVVPVTAGSNYVFDVRQLEGKLDRDTVGVFLTLGSTYTGHYDPILQVSKQLDDYEARTGISLPIHVDAASGGFVAPFTPGAEDLVW